MKKLIRFEATDNEIMEIPENVIIQIIICLHVYRFLNYNCIFIYKISINGIISLKL